MRLGYLIFGTSFLLFQVSAQDCNIASAQRETCGDIQESYLTCVARPLCCYDHTTTKCYKKRVPSATIQAEYFRALTYLQRVPKPPNLNPVIQAAQLSNSFVQRRAFNFSFTSILQREHPQCPVKVPLCYRTKCGQLRPFSQSNPSHCLMEPSCCFDQDLFLYRNMFGSSYMPRVPVCYHGVTSTRYLKLVALVRPWSPFFHATMTDAFSSSFGSSQPASCLFGNIGLFASSSPVCGWGGITGEECKLRDCCYDSATNKCTYPSTFNQFNQPSPDNNFRPELGTQSQVDAQCQSQTNFDHNVYGRLPCLLFGETGGGAATLLQCPQTQCCVDYSATLPNALGPEPLVGIPFFPFGQSSSSSANNSISTNPFLLAALASQANQPAGFTFPHQCPYLFTPIPGLPDLTSSVRGCCVRHACYHKKKFQRLEFPGQTSGPGVVPQPSSHPFIHPFHPAGSTQPPNVNSFPSQQPFIYQGPPQQPNPGVPQIPHVNPLPSQQLYVNPGATTFSDWSSWSGWTECSATCGVGKRSQYRTCRRNNNCVGLSQRSEVCYIANFCPTESNPRSLVWEQWGSWSPCSATCQFGTQLKVRKCVDRITRLVAFDSNSCGGERLKVKVCDAGLCTNATWGTWSNFTTCTALCNRSAIQRRRRDCLMNNMKVDNTQCPGSPQSRKLCRVTECIRIGDWQEWGECSVSCGEGVQRRIRPCFNDTVKVNSNCITEIVETQNCSSSCPDAVIRWGDWGEWEDCPVTCGNALKIRSRTCVLIGSNTRVETSFCTDLLETPQEQQRELCVKPSCYNWSPWSNYTSCSVSCGNGTQTSRRTCRKSNQNVLPINCFGSATRERSCQRPPCSPQKVWTPWSECTATCGRGRQLRFRCIPKEGGLCEVASIEFYKRDCIGLLPC